MNGRPTKHTPMIIHSLVESLAVGSTRLEAITVAGITPTTFYRWLKEDRNGFRNTIAQAEARCIIRLQKCIVDAAIKKDWRAAAYMCERIDARTLGEGNTKTKTQEEVDFSKLSDAEIEKRTRGFLGKKR